MRVSYDDTSGIGNQTWSYTVPAIHGAVSIVYPRDYTWVTGKLDVQIQSSYTSTNSMNVSIYDQNNKVVWASNCGSSNCINNLDSATLPDGRYEIQAKAVNQLGGEIDISSREFFYVVNVKPQYTVSFSGLNVDLKKDLKGRIEFDIRTTSSSVPMSSMEFHFRDATGVEKVRSAEIVLSSMTMGWRTNFVPNGSYEIWMTGKLKSTQIESAVESAHQMVRIKN
jgi:flagellar hook assembly protein FlgD